MDDLDTHSKESLRRARSSARPPEPAFERLTQRRERKHRNGRIASELVALAVVAGLVVGGVWTLQHRPSRHVVGSSGPSGQSGVSGPSVGATNPSLVAGPGQYYYSKVVHPIGNGPDVVEEIWWSTDGSGRIEVDQTNPNYGTPKSQTWGPGGPEWFGPGDDLSALSTDPSTLLQQLIARSSENGASPGPTVTLSPGLSEQTSMLWRGITNLVEAPNASPSLQAALFEVASGLDGVAVQQDVKDPVGRPAVAVSLQLGGYYCTGDPDTMWFDPGTHVLLASDGDLGCAPQTIVVAGGISDSTSDTVAPGDGYIPAPAFPVPDKAQPTSGSETVPAPEPSTSASR